MEQGVFGAALATSVALLLRRAGERVSERAELGELRFCLVELLPRSAFGSGPFGACGTGTRIVRCCEFGEYARAHVLPHDVAARPTRTGVVARPSGAVFPGHADRLYRLGTGGGVV